VVVKFKDLSLFLRITIIVFWIMDIILPFCLGFIKGVIGGLI